MKGKGAFQFPPDTSVREIFPLGHEQQTCTCDSTAADVHHPFLALPLSPSCHWLCTLCLYFRHETKREARSERCRTAVSHATERRAAHHTASLYTLANKHPSTQSSLELVLETVKGRQLGGEALALADAGHELVARLALSHGVSGHELPVVEYALG